MKCYACGHDEPGHLIACPEFRTSLLKKQPRKAAEQVKKEPSPQTFPDDSDTGWGFFDYKEDFIGGLTGRLDPQPEPTKVRRSFLPLEISSVASEAIVSISITPQLLSRPHRLWIDETIASDFLIYDIFIGSSPQFAAPGGIPANIFRTGRWPLPPNPDKDSEWGIDLSSWKVIRISQQFTITVKNCAPNYKPFRGALEVLVLP